MDEYILTYLQDILDAIEELDGYFCNYPMNMPFLKRII